MRTKLLLVMLAVLLCSKLWAQSRTRDFSLLLPSQKIQNSLYKNVKYLDSRADTSSLGSVQEGVFFKPALVAAKIPIEEQLQLLIDSLTNHSALEGELLFQTRCWRFVEKSATAREKGYCYLRAILYAKAGDRYRYINKIDTVVKVKSIDVTNTLLRNAAKALSDFIAVSLLMTPADTASYSLNDLLNITAIEKKNTRLYTAPKYMDGVYFSYESFKNQVPDKQAMVEMDDKNVHAVKLPDEKGRLEKLNPRTIYAVVHDGRPFIATEYGYYQIRKRKNDFFFIGKARTGIGAPETLASSYLYDIDTIQESTYEMKIDHYNGSFIPVRNLGYRAE